MRMNETNETNKMNNLQSFSNYLVNNLWFVIIHSFIVSIISPIIIIIFMDDYVI